MVIENIIPMFIGAVFFLAVASIALVHTLFGRHDTRLCIYSFTILSLTTSLLTLHWMERSGQISSNQDNTSIFLFICILLAVSFYVFGQRRHNK
jgi:membrane protein implicated in regulation of membrane protease activity